MKITTVISAYDKKRKRSITVVDQNTPAWNLEGPNPTAPLSVVMGNPNFTIMLDFEAPAIVNAETADDPERPEIWHMLEVKKADVDILHGFGCTGDLADCPVAQDLIENKNRGHDLSLGEYVVEGSVGNLTYTRRKVEKIKS